jgi:hypothetical protein
MKRTIALIMAGLLGVVVVVILTLRILISHSVRENITIAENHYPGSAEDALIAYLSDTANSTDDRTKIAIWTLGQTRSTKALPYLQELYNEDPEGRTCKGRHDSVLCQRELHKAIASIESGLPGAKKKIWLGFWQRIDD